MMDTQTIIVTVLVFAAICYAATMFFRKTKAFSSVKACDNDCGCSAKSKTVKVTR